MVKGYLPAAPRSHRRRLGRAAHLEPALSCVLVVTLLWYDERLHKLTCEIEAIWKVMS